MNTLNNLRNSITFLHNSGFDNNNITYAKKILSPDCNRFVAFQESDGTQASISDFTDFAQDLKFGSQISILASDSLEEPIADILEGNFQRDLRTIPPIDGILNFFSKKSIQTGQKELNIKTFRGQFALQRFGVNIQGIEMIPEFMTPPFDIIEYAGMFFLENDLIYISSNTPLSMKAAIFVLANPNIYEPTISNNKSLLMRLRHSYKVTDTTDLMPYAGNISIQPMKDIIDNTP